MIDLKALKTGDPVFYKSKGYVLESLVVKHIGRRYLTIGIDDIAGDRRFDMETGLEDSDYPGTLWQSQSAYTQWESDQKRKFELKQGVYSAIDRATLEQLEAIAAILGVNAIEGVA